MRWPCSLPLRWVSRIWAVPPRSLLPPLAFAPLCGKISRSCSATKSTRKTENQNPILVSARLTGRNRRKQAIKCRGTLFMLDSSTEYTSTLPLEEFTSINVEAQLQYSITVVPGGCYPCLLSPLPNCELPVNVAPRSQRPARNVTDQRR